MVLRLCVVYPTTDRLPPSPTNISCLVRPAACTNRWGNNAGKKWRGNRNPTASINFVCAHDGFTLSDLVAYNDKHNEANGENNKDGESHNLSWNCGAEGATERVDVNRCVCVCVGVGASAAGGSMPEGAETTCVLLWSSHASRGSSMRFEGGCCRSSRKSVAAVTVVMLCNCRHPAAAAAVLQQVAAAPDAQHVMCAAAGPRHPHVPDG